MEKISKLSFVLFAVLFFTASSLFICGGYLAYYGYFVLFAASLYGFLLVPGFFNDFFNKRVTPFLIFLLYFFVGSKMDIGWVMSYYTIFSSIIFIGVFYRFTDENRFKNVIKVCLIIIAILSIYLSIKTFFLLQINPNLLRQLASTERDDTLLIGGGFALPYSMALICPFVASKLKDIDDKLIKIVFLAFVISGIVLVIFSSFAIALFVLVFGFVFIFTSNASRVKRVIILLASIIVILTLPAILSFIISLYDNTEMSVVSARCNELLEMMQGKSAKEAGDGDIASRIDLTVSSIKTFLSYPIFGIGPTVNFDFVKMFGKGLGSHAYWFDIFAEFGLFALFLITYMIRGIKQSYQYKNWSIFSLVILGFLNPIHFFSLFFYTFFFSAMLNIIWPSNRKKILISNNSLKQ